MVRKFKWGCENKCGITGCDKEIIWGEFTSYLACKKHRNRKWGLCEACQDKKTTHGVFYDVYHGDDKAERAPKEVREGISFQKEIIEKFFSKDISGSLREKLNISYQKAQECEKIILELERLAKEYWEKKLNCASDFISAKGGQQTNIYESNLCDDCGDGVNDRQQRLKNDYRINVLDKLIVFSPATAAQIEKEIGKGEAQKIAFQLTFKNEKVKENDRAQVRYHFLGKLPFFKNKKTVEQEQKDKANFQKLKQFFQDNQIMQIVEKGGFEYIIWYANGNIEEKSSSQLAEWGKLRSYFFHYSTKNLSLHEINKELKSLDHEPNPNQEEEGPIDKNKENEKTFLSDLEREVIKKFFQQKFIKKVSLKNDKLVVTYNNNNNNEIINSEQLTKNPEYQLIESSFRRIGREELAASELGLNDNTFSTTDWFENKYLWLAGGITMCVTISGFLVFWLLRKKRKIN